MCENRGSVVPPAPCFKHPCNQSVIFATIAWNCKCFPKWHTMTDDYKVILSEKFYNPTDTNMRVVRVIKRNDFHCKWFLLRPFYENFTPVMEFFWNDPIQKIFLTPFQPPFDIQIKLNYLQVYILPYFLTVYFENKVNFHFFTRAYAIWWKSGVWLSIKDK